jgi:hypothetical protein
LTIAAVVGVAAAAAAPAQAAVPQVVSRSATGAIGDAGSLFPRVSADGRRVAFSSTASNLVPGDRNGESDVFLRDLTTRRIVRVSGALGGAPANGPSYPLSVSPAGRFVTFWSLASNLVADDRNDSWDVFVRDMRTGRTRLVDRNNRGAVSNQGAWAGAVVRGGRLAVFQSWASSLAHTGGISQIFLRNARGRTWAVTRTPAGALGNDVSELQAVTPDGRFVAYRTLASNLVGGDTNGTWTCWCSTGPRAARRASTSPRPAPRRSAGRPAPPRSPMTAGSPRSRRARPGSRRTPPRAASSCTICAPAAPAS